MTFWIVTSFMALAIVLLLSLTLLRARKLGEPAAASDLKVYRQQLRDVEKDLTKGVINQGDAERIRTEISRRILAADAQMQQSAARQEQPRNWTLVAAIVTGVVLIGGSLGLYSQLGALGYGDLPLQYRITQAQDRSTNRPSQSEAEAEIPASPSVEVEEGYLELVEQLRQTASERTDDAQGQMLLTQHEANLGNFVAAYQAKQNYIRIMSGDVEARDYAESAELMIMAAGGYISPEAETELRNALSLDRGHGPARYYWGVMLGQIGRPDMAYQIWAETLQAGPADAPWIQGIQDQIAMMAYRAGVEYTPITPNSESGAPLAGPTGEDVADAQQMSKEERQEMIRGMVTRLSERLASEGGNPQEWARLIGALGVLGEADRAKAIYAEALQTFASDEAALTLITGAAQQAGIEQ
ncbi:c-type cytochrome biogenesis protein CcmI [Parasedimentitalea maritima]|uniref:C-type cytochrome biogenesis protein CcmI n=1 Tax=Parasedimentitalea maritima TaxID=2578117 RepID=A0ABY2USB6_9RHOB|nr:c-type cytochrome biogenesis protein CcmI [Zongyanglinia marina]TLP60449.1 c-type cytochrome biogenesis protein CcmI [Zongyanglinia marina]